MSLTDLMGPTAMRPPHGSSNHYHPGHPLRPGPTASVPNRGDIAQRRAHLFRRRAQLLRARRMIETQGLAGLTGGARAPMRF